MAALPVHFACTSDRRYLDALVATVTAVCRQLHPDSRPVFHLVDIGLPAADAERALTCLRRRFPRLKTAVHRVDPARFADWPDYTVPHIARNVYSRLFFDEFLTGVDRCVFLDTDILVDADITKLYRTHLDGAFVGAVQSGLRPHLAHYPVVRPHLPPELAPTAHALNSGVMVVDLVRVRAEGAMARVRTIAPQLREKCGDQALCNLAFAGRWKAIDPRWNRQIFLTPKFSVHRTEPHSLWHVIGPLKPWLVDRTTAHGIAADFHRLFDVAGWQPVPEEKVRVNSSRWREFAKATHAALSRHLRQRAKSN